VLAQQVSGFLVAFVFVTRTTPATVLRGDVVELVFPRLVPAMCLSAVMNEPMAAFDKSPVLLGVEFEHDNVNSQPW